jgi:hypothetical protein
VIEVTAPQPPVSFAGARPRLRCAHRAGSVEFLKEPATASSTSKVPGAAVHKRMKLRIARLGGGHCEELRLACENKDRLGEQGEGNCRRYRQMCGQRQSRQQVCEQLLRVSRRISSASRARAIVGVTGRRAEVSST